MGLFDLHAAAVRHAVQAAVAVVLVRRALGGRVRPETICFLLSRDIIAAGNRNVKRKRKENPLFSPLLFKIGAI